MYEAIVTKITNVREHPNADRINLGIAAGHQVVISKDTVEGTLGVFFPCDGRLSSELLKQNNLFKHTELNRDPDKPGGFFDDSGRVRVQSFRGANSEGYWAELSLLEFTGADLSKLKSGDMITKLNDVLVCQKYYTPATIRAMRVKERKGKVRCKGRFPQFKEHWSTPKLRMAIQFIPVGAVLYFSEKCHGTSGRTGLLPKVQKLNRYQSLVDWLLRKVGLQVAHSQEYQYVTGTRRRVLDTEDKPEFSTKEKYRVDIHEKIKQGTLHKGETLYYEIVGHTDAGKPIMGSHKVSDKAMKKKFGDTMTYTYGCDEGNPYRVLVYRITHTREDGSIIELPQHQLEARCTELGIGMVPQLHKPIVYDGHQEVLLELCEKVSQGRSTLDDKHIKEGVVIRVQATGSDTHLKYKSFQFCDLEGIRKNTPDYVDIEEIA